VEDNRKEEGKEEKEDSSKTKEKKLSVEEQRESAKIEKCYKASLLKLQKAFKIPELEE
jgi:hypothetical protein